MQNKQFGSSTSNYHVTATKDCFDKDENKNSKHLFVGKIRANNHKSQYIVFDNGSAANTNSNKEDLRKELGFIFYK